MFVVWLAQVHGFLLHFWGLKEWLLYRLEISWKYKWTFRNSVLTGSWGVPLWRCWWPACWKRPCWPLMLSSQRAAFAWTLNFTEEQWNTPEQKFLSFPATNRWGQRSAGFSLEDVDFWTTFVRRLLHMFLPKGFGGKRIQPYGHGKPRECKQFWCFLHRLLVEKYVCVFYIYIYICLCCY